jgi:Ring finger domain
MDAENIDLLTDDVISCSVCLETINDVDIHRTDACQHTFHKPCLDKWLESHNTCPECRIVIFETHAHIFHLFHLIQI